MQDFIFLGVSTSKSADHTLFGKWCRVIDVEGRMVGVDMGAMYLIRNKPVLSRRNLDRLSTQSLAAARTLPALISRDRPVACFGS
jgi:hypothetical protein